MGFRHLAVGVSAGLVFLIGLPVSAETVYLTPEAALKLLFKDSEKVVSETRTLTPEQKTQVEKKIGSRLAKDRWTFYIGKTAARVDGYALIDHEVGKTEPISFITAITPEGKVDQVEILVYREPIGSEVRERRFLQQYEGKKGEDPVAVGRDIANISGATLSAQGVSRGVKRALVLWEVLFQP